MSSFQILLVFTPLVFYFVGAEGRLFSRNEDLELERQLKILNKPAVKTLQTKHGDIYDCVDINKQPAFDHPLLQNHKVQTRPSFLLEETTPSMATSSQLGVLDEECPAGTVPIRRTTKQDLIQQKSLYTQMNFSNYKAGIPNVGLVYGEKAYGTSFFLNVWGLKIDAAQYSGAGTWVQNGADIIQAGWIVDSGITGDGRTRLFTYWTNGNSGCYNTLCEGFVQFDKRVVVGAPINHLSTYNGPQFEIHLEVQKDPNSQDWWLIFNGNIPVGYWPKSLFNSLADDGGVISWGGFGIEGVRAPSPPIGNGHVGTEGDKKACYIRDIKLIEQNGRVQGLDIKLAHAGSYKKCYVVTGYEKEGDQLRFYFGGPGGC
ncbi:protein neprosin-like [Aristolochia californica]|uniref:protein neprosin-like n=1 Tax=Aristolochia californica TaxID=171875 RepID=UPI0035D8698A